MGIDTPVQRTNIKVISIKIHLCLAFQHAPSKIFSSIINIIDFICGWMPSAFPWVSPQDFKLEFQKTRNIQLATAFETSADSDFLDITKPATET